MCRKILRHPTRNIDVLNERFEVIEFCLNPENQSIVENLTSCLKHVYRLTNVILDRHLAQQTKVSDWRRLHKVLIAFFFYSFFLIKQLRNVFVMFTCAFCINAVDNFFHNLHRRYMREALRKGKAVP